MDIYITPLLVKGTVRLKINDIFFLFPVMHTVLWGSFSYFLPTKQPCIGKAKRKKHTPKYPVK